MGEIILHIWEFLQISPRDSHFPDTFLKYLTTKKYIVWNMAFLWTNLRVRYIFFSLRYIGMTEYWNSIILDFNQSYLLKNGSKQKKIQEMAIKMPINIVVFFYEALMSGLFWHRCAGISCLLDLGHMHRLCMFSNGLALSVLGYFKSATKSKNTNFHIC